MVGVSAEQATFSNWIQQNQQKKALSVDMSQAMWKYRNLKQFAGIPLDQQAKDLPVDNLQQVQKALELKTDVKTWTGYLSPQSQDRQNVQHYNKIQQGLAKGTIRLFDQQKHFCSSVNKILVLITYGQLKYVLNPRYKYLRGQINVTSKHND